MFTFSTNAQLIEVNKSGEVASEYSLQQLIENVLISGDCAEIDSFESIQTGTPTEISTKSYGFFNRGANTSFPFNKGIMLTSGRAQHAGNNLITNTLDITNGTLGDADLETALGVVNTQDATFIKFNFKTYNDTISFRFLMASEEYNMNTECSFADSFAFLLREVGTKTYTNLAVLPDGTPISTTNINNAPACADNIAFFEGYNLGDTNYGGRTKVLTAISNVTPGVIYEIKLVIADQGDSEWDSAVFLEAGSFNLGIDLGEDLLTKNNNAACGTYLTLDASITANDYQWFKDGVIIPGAINQTYDANLGNGVYKVETSFGTVGCKTSGEIKIEFVTSPIANKPKDISYCDSDGDGFNTFDFNTEITSQVLNGQNTTDFEVLYFDTLNKATENITGSNLPNSYTNNTAFNSQQIYARIHHRNSPTTCFATTNFNLSVNDLPKPIQPTVYRLCDDTASAGGNTDGITNNFILSSKDAEILGTLSATQYAVSYHTLLADAQTSSTTNAIDKNTDYQVNNSQNIYVRVENIDNANCNTVSDDTAGSLFMSFQLIVDALPIIKTNPVIIKQCDDNPDLITTFNLTEAEISISDNRANETFEYYASQAEAIAGTPEVADKLRYPVSNTGEAWVRTISEFGCYRISKIELIVSFAGDVNYSRSFIECDDLLDADGNNTAANSDTDGISFFDFSEAEQEILDLFPVLIQPNLEVLFYESTADRTASINEIPDISNHRNNNDPAYANTQTIFVRIKNKVNNDCTGIGQFTLTVNSTPLANAPIDLNLCDDDASGSTVDGENSGINLRDNVDEILGATQTETDYIVSFHTSATGANTNTDIITNDTNFTNSAQTGFALGDISEQIIYVRVQNRNGATQCFNDHVSFKIIVNPVPTVSNTITPFAVCDIITPSDSDPRNRVAQNIDLTSKDIEILDGKINHRVAYYATQQDAQDGNEISNPTVFQNITSETNFPADFSTDDPGIETIFFKVFDLGGNMCESVFATFQLLIYPEPNIPINISDYSDCDNTSDSFADDANGINGDITLKNKIPEILVNYLPSEFADFSVTFYTSLADAEAGNMALALDENIFENNANNQTIYVRVENTKNTPIACVHTGLSFNINIKPIPNFTVMGEEDIDTPQIVCLNDTPLTLEAENPAATYDYTWTDQAGTTLGTDVTLDVTTGGKYTIIATDQSPDGCSRKRIIVVNESNVAILKESFITIIDESNTISSNDNISISIDTISNDLGPGDYQFALRNDDNGDRFPIIGFQDEPLFENLEGGIYTIIVNDKNGCSPDTELQISVIQFPKFFTPNGDGKNDTWIIKGANKTFYPNSSINIFNRFGKLVAQVPIDSQGWNGTYNSKTLPSDDYWFNIQLIPADTSKSPILNKGHFSLLRR
ncbi:hypothetical protein BTO07_00795 [Polaribacter sp. SA4-12]|nr:hypothetical protein BTO07_00795 [Polaribacter sp. SA4-12]